MALLGTRVNSNTSHMDVTTSGYVLFQKRRKHCLYIADEASWLGTVINWYRTISS